MKGEFRKTDLNSVTSSRGFTVDLRFAGGIHYRDSASDLAIDAEWLLNPPRILLYRQRGGSVPDRRLDEVYSNVQNALEYLGHRVEIHLVG